MTAARRLAAILAADVVGYSRLMGDDGAGGARASRGRVVDLGWPPKPNRQYDELSAPRACARFELPRAAPSRAPMDRARAIDRIGVIPYKLRVY